jgi:hypothetical protein
MGKIKKVKFRTHQDVFGFESPEEDFTLEYTLTVRVNLHKKAPKATKKQAKQTIQSMAAAAHEGLLKAIQPAPHASEILSEPRVAPPTVPPQAAASVKPKPDLTIMTMEEPVIHMSNYPNDREADSAL